MPSQLTVRQERFVQLLHKGTPAYRAYPEAGYPANNGKPYRLKENERVKRRLEALQAPLMRKTQVTATSLVEDLREDRALAHATGQAGAAVSATMAIAKLCGMIINKSEIGAPGSFDQLGSIEDIVDRVRAELGDRAADAVLAAFADNTTEPLPTSAD
jgi:hypothetical protein